MARSRYYQKVAIESYLRGAKGHTRTAEEVRDDLDLEGDYYETYLEHLASTEGFTQNGHGYYWIVPVPEEEPEDVSDEDLDTELKELEEEIEEDSSDATDVQSEDSYDS